MPVHKRAEEGELEELLKGKGGEVTDMVQEAEIGFAMCLVRVNGV